MTTSLAAVLALALLAAPAFTQELLPGDTKADADARAIPVEVTQPGLGGTTWQLVRFEGGDGRILTAHDKSKYTIAFANDGGVSVRIDCNRGRGTWKSADLGQLELGPLALTRATCPPSRLNGRLTRDWANMHSYILRDDHLFIQLMADVGTYEFQPAL